jgi:hypothetical protein
MVMIVIGFDLLRLRIAVHQRFHHLAQRILLQRGMAGQKSSKTGEDDRLCGQQRVTAALFRRFGVP